jgi:NitT/TauT family transport system substrate-binding protein
MSNGEIDIAYVGVAPVIVALDSGLDAKIVASVQTNGSHLALRQEINYTSPEDLAGLRIATFQPCSVMDLVLKRWLVENGLDPESDLEIIPMTSGAAIDAMGNGTVDGVFLPHPDPAIIELNNYGRMVIASGTMWPNHACCCLVVSGRLIREHPDLVRQIVYTHSKATNYITTNHEAAAQTFANKTGMDFGVVNYSLNTWDGTWVSNPRIGLNSSLEIAERMYAEGCVNNSLSKGDLFDLRFYDEMSIFDTGPGSYPSISGTHNGTIRPYRDIAVSTLYTYRCLGTGGHTEYIKIWNSITGWNVTATWNGYKDDWHNLSFNNSFTLYANETYNYTIRTGSYPQIIHEQSWNATGGKITCTDFVDVNGKRHYNWIPAIKLYFVDTSVADLTLEEARAIAQNSSCVQEGTLTDTYIYNEYSRTWWFDLEPFTVMPGCNPACVISEDTRTAEINWRCTMATTP